MPWHKVNLILAKLHFQTFKQIYSSYRAFELLIFSKAVLNKIDYKISLGLYPIVTCIEFEVKCFIFILMSVCNSVFDAHSYEVYYFQ